MTMRRRHDAVRGTPAGGYEDSLAGSIHEWLLAPKDRCDGTSNRSVRYGMSSPPRFRTAVRTQRLPAWLRLFLIGCMLLVSQPAGAAPGQVVDLDDLLAQNQPCVTTNVSS